MDAHTPDGGCMRQRHKDGTDEGPKMRVENEK